MVDDTLNFTLTPDDVKIKNQIKIFISSLFFKKIKLIILSQKNFKPHY